jgi:hypothetical protein
MGGTSAQSPFGFATLSGHRRQPRLRPTGSHHPNALRPMRRIFDILNYDIKYRLGRGAETDED